MDGPYRSAPRAEGVEAPRDRGIVGEVVAQFADPLAFYRELVQNAIDAGSASVDVELRHDPGAAAARVVVRDRGEGMDRDLIENSLLVLFRSTKDRDPTKIGRFGIGFSSVLGPRPRIVVIDTVRGGRRLIVHLHPDLSYQLFEGGPATRNGTSVELELPIEAGGFTELVGRSRIALVRWCRHAAVPIQFTARGGAGEPLADERIDRPLALDGALIEVRGVSADGATTAVVGLMPGGAAYGGFFNRGLMLHESKDLFVARVGFKVLDHRLGHTLSRDDVRRDGAFEAALELVRELATGELVRATAAELAVHAATALADPAALERWRSLFTAADTADLALDDDQWSLPLLVPVGRFATAIRAAHVPRRAWIGSARTRLAEALAAAGEPVLADLVPEIRARVARCTGRRPVEVERALTLAIAETPNDAERRMLDHLAEFLDGAGHEPGGLLLATLDGALAARPWVSGGPDHAMITVDGERWILDHETASASPFRWLRRRALVLNAGDAVVAAARARADEDPVGAASALARVVLLHHGKLDAGASARLLEATLSELGLVRDP